MVRKCAKILLDIFIVAIGLMLIFSLITNYKTFKMIS